MNFGGTLIKRIVAFLLALVMVFTSGDFMPGIVAALAEGEAASVTEENTDAVQPTADPDESVVLDDAVKAELEEAGSAAQQEETPAVEETAVQEEPQQEETPVVEEPVVEEEPTQEETPAIEEPVVEEEPKQEETPAVEEPVVVEEPQQEETPAVEEPVVEEEPQQKETPAKEEQILVSGVSSTINVAPVGEPVVIETSAPAATPVPAEETDPAVGLLVMPAETEDANTEANEAAENGNRELQIQVGDYIITAVGSIPEGAEIQAVEIPAETAAKMTNKELLFAYDIRLVVDGKVWQPEEYGASVQISVKDANGGLGEKDIDIVHVKTDLMNADGSLSEEAVEKAVQGLQDGNVEKERIDTDASESAVSFDTGSFSGFLGTAMAKLQSMLKEAMKNKAAGDKSVQLNLDKDTTYEGDVEFDADQLEVEDGFEVKLVSADAGDDYLQSAGTTSVAGNIIIKGIKLALMGVSIAAGNKVTVENAKLDYYGTKAADTLEVELGEGSSANIKTGEGGDTVTVTGTGAAVDVDTGVDADTVNVTANGGSADIKTGEGDDTVTVTTNDAATAAIDTGAGDDKVTATVKESTASIVTGDGDDSVTATLSGNNTEAPAKLDINSGAGNDTVKLTDDASNGTAKIVTGQGDDNVEVDAHTAGNGGIEVDTGLGDDTVTLNNTGSAPNPIGKINVSLGSGNDTANVDVSLSTAATEVILSGGAGDDTANFTGALGDGDEKNKRVQIVDNKLKFISSNGRTLNVTNSGFERLTDTLSNKETVKLTPKNGVLYYDATDPGINYTIEIPAKEIKTLQITSEDGKFLPLSNLVINTATEVDGVNKLIISEGTVIDVHGLNLKLESKNIEINGTIVADDVSITADDGGKFLNVTGESKIVITDKAAIYSSGDVMIIAKVTMAGPMLDTNALAGVALDIAPINSINVKIAHASVDIAGKVYAGVENILTMAVDYKNSKPTFKERRGSVTAKAETSVSMGVDENGKPQDSGWPVAVSVANVEASVNVQKGAVIEAAKDVTTASKSTLKAGTRASSGFVGAPASAAVAVLINDAHTRVDGAITAHHGNANITADGTLEATTVADRGDGQKIISGGYAAVTVALQDVTSIVGSGTVVKAAGDVAVTTNAVEKVVDKAAASSLSEAKQEEKKDDGILGTVKEKVGDLLGSLKDKLIEKITGSGKVEKKLKKALELLPVSDKTVTLDSKAQQKGQVSADVVTENGKTKVQLNLEPWEGYAVKRIIVRGYLPGENFWNVKTLTQDEIAGKNKVDLDAVGNRMIVYVEYEETQGGSDDDWQPSDLFDENPNSNANQDDDELDEDTWRPSDLFDLDDMMNGVQGGTEGNDEDGASSEGSVKLELGGGVLTYDFLPGSPDKNLEKVNPGDAIRLIPNPASDKKLKEGGLKATYTVKEKVEKDGKEEEKDVEKTIVITQDAQGRYILNVPETFETDKGIKVTADFEDGAQSQDADESQTQITGSVAVTVAHNDSQALIEQGTTVVAGGSADTNSTIKTDVSTTADGSSVSKDSVPASGPAAPASYPIQRAKADNFDGYAKDDQFMFGMILGEMINGDAEFKVATKTDDKGEEQEIPYAFIITPKPIKGYSAVSATLTYYQGGESHTVELKKAEDGTYRVMLEQSTLGSLIGYYTLNEECYNKVETGKLNQVVDFVKNLIGGTNGIDKGSNITINIAFASEDESGVFHSATQPKPMLNHIIGIKYNKLKDEKNEVTFKETKREGDKTYYVFDAMADANNGYTLDGKLKATWEGSQGVELEQKDGAYWYLDASLLPDNVKVTVNAEFKEQFRDFKKADDIKNGTLTLYDEKVKKADKPRFTVKPDAGYSVEDIEITYTKTNALGKDEKVTLKLSDKDSKITKAKDLTDVYTFTVDDAKEGTEIKVNAKFVLKTIGVYAGNGNADQGKYLVSENNVAAGDKVIVSLTDKDAKDGKKIESVKVEVQGKPSVTVKVNDDGSFEVPKEGITSGDKLVITNVNIVNKEVKLEAAKLEHGSVTPDVPYADKNEIVTVTVKPDDNFKIKKDTLKALIKSDDGTYTEEVMMRRQSDNSYAFTMPTTMRSGVTLTFVGEFEPGQSDSSKVETSVGAGIAVSVVSSEGRADVKGAVTGGSVNVKSASEGAVSTESKAGYSAGNIGVGGAVSVQIASVDSKALIHDSAELDADIEASAIAANKVDYSVNADASGSKEADKTGVGAGIAVAVNGADTYAAMNDKAKLSGALLGGGSIVASQFLSDSVTAKAGASGGSAGVPVAAVDVSGGSAQAYLGRLNDGAKLDVGGSVNVNAANLANHAVSADASAAGKGVGVGAAIDVTVISDKAEARLNQGVNATSVAVTSETESRLSSTATASASGGLTSEKGGKNPDKQADGLMDMVAQMAAMNSSDSASQEIVETAKSENRQKAETSEGSVAVAGAVAVNVQSSTSRSEIMSGVDVKSLGGLSVTALNGTTASVKANASTTKSNVGVGVGVAVNIIKLQNIASLSDGEIEAAMLKVAANTKLVEPETAAAAAEPTPEELEALAKEEAKKTLTNEIGAAVSGFVKDLIVSMGLDGYVSASLISDITDKVAADATQEVLKTMGLDETLGTMTFEQIAETAKAAVEQIFSGMSDEPAEGVVDKNADLTNALATLTDEQKQALKTVLESHLGDSDTQVDPTSSDSVKEALESIIGSTFAEKMKEQLPELPKTLMLTAKDGLVDYLKQNVAGILSGLFADKDKGDDAMSKLTDQATQKVTHVISNKVKVIISETLGKTVGDVALTLTTELPEVDMATLLAAAVKEDEDSDAVNEAADEAAGKVNDEFAEKVPYKEMLENLSKEDFKTKIIEGLRAGAKQALITLSNEALNAMTEHFDLALEAAENPATGHVIETQAISGAGAKDVGVAGSVAVTVLNADTSATIADSGKAITVSGDMTVSADEQRTVSNVASAAVNAAGDAVANLAAGNEESSKIVGDGEAKSVASNEYGTDKKQTVKLTVGLGGTAEILQAEKADNRPKTYISLAEGYRLPNGNKIGYVIKDEDGKETGKGTVTAQKDGDRWYIDTKAGDLRSVNAKYTIELEVKPEEILHAVNAPAVSGADKGAVSVSVKDRKPVDGKINARSGEMVQITVDKSKAKDVQVDSITYTVNGQKYQVLLNKDAKAADGNKAAYGVTSSNEKELIYTFAMPDGDIGNLQLSFVQAEESESDTAAADSSGHGVGVGASFSMAYGSSAVKADVGGRNVTAGALSVTADSAHAETLASVAGTDPIGASLDANAIKKTAVDASVALNILDNDIVAQVAKTAKVTTTGYTDVETDDEGNVVSTTPVAGDLKVAANETAVDTAVASAFSAGGSTAVGASVAINIASSKARALLEGGATVAGSATVAATGTSADVTRAVATALGADIARSLMKLNMGAQVTAAGANSLLNGSAADSFLKGGDKPAPTDTNKKINERLNATDKKAENGDATDDSLSLSQNVMRSQGVETQSEDAGSEGTKEGMDELKANSDDAANLKDEVQDTSSKVQVGAAVGVSVTGHAMQTVVGTIKAAGGITATAQNIGNFNTQGTGAAMSFAERANSIAIGVAVSVNSNKANVSVDGDLVSTGGGDVSATANLNQNLTGEFAGKLATQSLSGSVAGEGSSISLGGAISVLASKGEATVDITGGASGAARKIDGGSVTVESTDKSRLASRAGGISLSGGSSVGMGIASNVIVSGNKVYATVGDNAEITADSFKLNAEKQAVTAEDFKQLINLRTLVTDSSNLTDEQRANAKTGFIDYHKTKDADGRDSYEASVNLSSDRLLDLIDGLNFLSGQNTYVEAIAGSVATGNTTANLSGSIAVAVNNNDIKAKMGNNVTIKAKTGDANVTASNGATTRVIAGSLSGAPADVSVGVTVAVLVNSDKAVAQTGNNASVDAAGGFKHTADQSGDTQLFTGAMSVAAGGGTAIGGAINVIVNKSVADSIIGNNANLKAGGDADIHSKTKLDLTLISGSANVGTGTVAAGGTVNVIVDKGESVTKLGANNAVTAGGSLFATSDSSTQMISGVASASVAKSTGGTGAGAVNVIVSKSVVNTTVGGGAKLTATAGDLKLNANNDAWMLNATVAAAGAGGTAIGGAFNVNVFDRQATVNLVDGTLKAGGDLLAQTSGRDTTIMAGLALAGGVSGAAVSGNVGVLVEKNKINTNISKGVTAEAGKNAVLEAYYSDYTVDAAGSIALSGSSAAVGATVLTVVKNNNVCASLGKSDITADAIGGDTVKSMNGTSVQGVYVGANAAETQLLGAAGVSGGLGASMNGVVDVLVNNNTVFANASEAALRSPLNETKSVQPVGGGVAVQATDETTQVLLAGGLSISASAGVGASVVTLVSNKTVRALAYDVEAAKDVKVTADNNDDVTTIAVSAGGGTVGVQIGAAVQVMKSNVNAEVRHNVNSSWGGLTVATRNNTSLNNAAVALAGAAAAAVTPVGVVTYFNGSANTAIKEGSAVSVSQNVNVTAEANKEIGLYSVGAAAAGGAGVSGTANVIVSKDQTTAKVEKNASVESKNLDLNVQAGSDYDLTSATASVGAGTAGVAVNAVVSVIKSKTLAEMAGKASLGRDLNVKAKGTKDITNVGANLAAGAVGVGVNVMVLVTGTKMSQDAADMMAKGGKENGNTFNAQTLMKSVASNDHGGSKYYQNELNGDILADDTAGNGRRESQISVGGTQNTKDKDGKTIKSGTFDATSGYRDKDFDNGGFNDDGDAQRGENLQAKDTSDVANAKNLNTYTYTDDPQDAVIARITDTAVVTDVKSVNVTAEQPVTADLFGATVAGGAVGVGVTAAVAILRSNVLAESKANITASGDVNVNANSISNGNVANRSNVLKTLLKGIDPENGGIRAIGATATVGGVGVAVGAGVVLTDNVTSAKLGGVVTSGGANVNATQDYGHITAAVGALSAGGIAIGAAVGVAQSNATVTSKIEDKANVTATGDVSVTSKTTQNVTSLAATAGVGGIAVNAGVAVAINRMNQNTGIGKGATVSANNINVKATSDTTADSGLLGISVGGVGVALGAAVSQVNANVNTLVDSATIKAKGGVSIYNDTSSTATPKAVSLALGGVAAGGNVLLAFNDTKSQANVTGSTVNADKLYVVADLQGTATSQLAAAQVGAFQVGLSVNYADMKADNRAILKDSTVNVRDLKVHTGESNHDNTSAVADTVAGGMGFIALNMNAAIARNNAHSYAMIDGGDITATERTFMRSVQKTEARASVTGVNAGLLAITANVVVALNDSDTRTIAKADRLETGNAEFSVAGANNARTDIVTGGGALFKADASIGVAYGRASKIVDVDVKKLTASKLEATTNANSATASRITNGSYAAVKAGVLMGGAYSQDIANTVVKMGDGSKITGDTSVTTNYDISANSDVTPHKGGLDVNLANIGVNLSTAKSTAYAGADLIVDNGTAEFSNVNVQTTGKGATSSIIRPTKIEVSLVKVATNKSKSDLSMTQFATIHLNNGSTLDASGNVNVKSYVTPTATAEVGNSGADKGTVISLVNMDLSFAHAKENQAATAGIYGSNNSKLNAANLNVVTDNINQESYTYASSNAAASYGFATIGNLDARAIASDDFSSVLDKVSINATGRVNMYAWTNSHSVVRGGVPGGFALIDGGASYTNADIGESNDHQTAQILVGDGVKVNANQLEFYVRNTSNADANMERGGAYSLAKVQSSSQPTHTYLTTNLLIGKNVELTTKDWMSIYMRNYITAQSIMNNESKGVILNVDIMKGENYLTERNMLQIDEGAKLKSGGNMEINALSTANMNARTEYKNESYGLIGAGAANAVNELDREQRIQLMNGVTAESGGIHMDIWSRLGRDDHINTFAKMTVRSALEFPGSYALNRANLYNAVNVGSVNLTANTGKLWVYAHTGGKYEPRGDVDAATSIKLGAAPEGISRNIMRINNEVNLNENGYQRASFISKQDSVNVQSELENLWLYCNSFVEGSSAFGSVKNICNNNLLAGATARIWVDNADFSSKTGTNLKANMGDNGFTAFFEEKPEAALYALLGGETANAKLEGAVNARIITANRNDVHVTGSFYHVADASYRHYFETKCTGWKNVKGYREKEFSLSANRVCDFCGDITAIDHWDGLNPVFRTGTFGSFFNSGWHLTANNLLSSAFSKALAPINEVNRMVNGLDDITKARYGEEEDQAAGTIYVLDVDALLLKDVSMNEDRLDRYRMWTNNITQHDVYLLPNSDRFFRGVELDYVSEVLRGDARDDGESFVVEVYTALNDYAFQNPVVPIGSAASLNFATGALSLPTLSDYELYLHEVSGAWLLDQIDSGLFRWMDAPVDDATGYVLSGDPETAPTGEILEGFVKDAEDMEDWTLYWLGRTPDEAEDDETLIALLHNEQTDEVDALRTTKAMMAAGKEAIDVSLYIFRDNRADRMGEEKYDILVFDTPAGEKSLFKVITDVLEDRELEMPKTLKVILRAFKIDGADMPAYSLTDHFFILCDGTDGEVSLFDGFYNNTFDGDTFDSDYLRIEGIMDNRLNVTIKKDQIIWPEKNDETHATDMNGTDYEQMDGEWQMIVDIPA